MAFADDIGARTVPHQMAPIDGASVLRLVNQPSTAAAAAAAPAAARGRYLATFQYSFAAASVIAPAFFGGLYAVGHALPFLVLGVVNALSVPALLRLEEPLTARSRTH